MVRNKKGIILISIFIMVAIGLSLGFYGAKSGWGDKFHRGIENIDWVMILSFVLITVIDLFLFIFYLFNKKKAGRSIFAIYPSNYKIQVNILIFDLTIIIFLVVSFILSPSIHAVFLIGMIAVIVLDLMLTIYFMNGLCENGLIYAGGFHKWEKILAYNFETNKLLIFKVKSKRKGCIELKYFIKNNNFEEIESYLLELVKVNKIEIQNEGKGVNEY